MLSGEKHGGASLCQGGAGSPPVCVGGGGSVAATLFLQHVVALLVLGPEGADKKVWGDLPPSASVHTAPEDVVED